MASTEDDVRRIAPDLPATTEKPSYGTRRLPGEGQAVRPIREEGDVVVLRKRAPRGSATRR